MSTKPFRLPASSGKEDGTRPWLLSGASWHHGDVPVSERGAGREGTGQLVSLLLIRGMPLLTREPCHLFPRFAVLLGDAFSVNRTTASCNRPADLSRYSGAPSAGADACLGVSAGPRELLAPGDLGSGPSALPPKGEVFSSCVMLRRPAAVCPTSFGEMTGGNHRLSQFLAG